MADGDDEKPYEEPQRRKPGRPRGSKAWEKYEPKPEVRAKLLSAFEPIDPNVEQIESALTVLERNMVMHATLGSRIIELAGKAQRDHSINRLDAMWLMELGFRHREIAGKTAIAVLPFRHARIAPIPGQSESPADELASPVVEPVVVEDIGRTLERVRKSRK